MQVDIPKYYFTKTVKNFHGRTAESFINCIPINKNMNIDT